MKTIYMGKQFTPNPHPPLNIFYKGDPKNPFLFIFQLTVQNETRTSV